MQCLKDGRATIGRELNFRSLICKLEKSESNMPLLKSLIAF